MKALLDLISGYVGRRYWEPRLSRSQRVCDGYRNDIRHLFSVIDELQDDFADELNRHRDWQPPTLKQHREITDMLDQDVGGEIDITDPTVTMRVTDEDIRWVRPINGRIRVYLARQGVSTPRGAES